MACVIACPPSTKKNTYHISGHARLTVEVVWIDTKPSAIRRIASVRFGVLYGVASRNAVMASSCSYASATQSP